VRRRRRRRFRGEAAEDDEDGRASLREVTEGEKGLSLRLCCIFWLVV